jgi:integrase
MARARKRDGVYTRKDRKGLWISWTDAQGKRRYRKTDSATVQQARLLRSSKLLAAEKSRTLGFTPPGAETFAEVAVRFLAHQKARLSRKAYEREKGIVENHLKPFFNGQLASVRRVDVQRYITKRSGKVSAHTVQKELNILKHLLSLAVEWDLIPLTPAHRVKSPKVPPGRVRYLQPTELRLLINECPEWLQPIAALAAVTGMRRGEILGLRWLDVDFAGHRILLPQTKNNEGRVIYLNASAEAVLQSLVYANVRATDKVFPHISPGQVTVAFRRICQKLGIANFRFHDLRHTAASWLRMQGADIHTVAQLLGHKDLRMAARYQHLSPQFLAEAVGKLDDVFGNLCYQGVTSPKALKAADGPSC